MGRYVISDKSTYKVAADAVIAVGDQIYMDADNFAAPAAAPTASLVGFVVGSAVEKVDNTGGSDGDKTVTVEHSCGSKAFLLAGSGIDEGDVGKTCYVGANPKQVTLTATNAITSGKVQGVEDDGRIRVVFTL